MHRTLHPGAWWAWAIGLATAASRTTNPLLLGLILAVAVLVVLARQAPVPWAAGLRLYLGLAVVIVAVRVVFRIVLGAGTGQTVLFVLPELQLPAVVQGIRLGGPVSGEGLLAAVYDGLRLAAILVCIGAANLLADPRRLVRAVPGALYEIGTAVVVALTIAPQLVISVRRVRRAGRLRGVEERGWRGWRRILTPVLQDALDRSLHLAAAMESRGYGRVAAVSVPARRRSAAVLLVGLVGLCVGIYGLLDGTAPQVLGAPMLGLGVALSGAGLHLAGRRIARSTYRPDPWRGAEWLTLGFGLGAAVGIVVVGRLDPVAVFTPSQPLTWPALPALAVAAILLAALPAGLTPPPSKALP